MKHILALGLALGVLAVSARTTEAAPAPSKAQKKALQQLQAFVGGWKGSGGTKLRPGPRDPFWSEKVMWSWKFKGDDCWMLLTFDGGKFLKSAEVRYLADKKKYQLIGTPVKGTGTFTFEGTWDEDDQKLTMQRVDADSKDTQRVRINLAGDGVRLVYVVDRKTSGGTIWKPEFALGATKLGESLALTKKGPECIVSGGRGTISVSYMGTSYYVCCSGCADAFKENPKKYVDEYNKKKKK
jgi:YHS domain-containing protein